MAITILFLLLGFVCVPQVAAAQLASPAAVARAASTTDASSDAPPDAGLLGRGGFSAGVGAAASAAVEAAAQDQSAAPPTPPHTGLHALFHNLIEDVTKLPAMQNVYIAAAGGGLALAVHPADPKVNAKLSGHWNAVFAPGKYVGNTPEQVGASLVTFALGRLTHKPKVSHLANDLLQAQILSELLVEPLKIATQRLRPYQTSHCGLNCSFPSGHASTTFADATVVLRHLGWRYSAIGYAIAVYVVASRLHDNQHYLSDVVFGAATGSIAGRTVVHHAKDYWALTPVPVPGGGIAVLATRVRDTN